jgi:hypothetical protein
MDLELKKKKRKKRKENNVSQSLLLSLGFCWNFYYLNLKKVQIYVKNDFFKNLSLALIITPVSCMYVPPLPSIKQTYQINYQLQIVNSLTEWKHVSISASAFSFCVYLHQC